MGKKEKEKEVLATEEVADFSTKRVGRSSLKTIYQDEVAEANRRNAVKSYGNVKAKKLAEINKIFEKALSSGLTSSQRQTLADASARLYMTNPIYADTVNYFATFFMYRYKVIPHRLYSSSKVKLLEKPDEKTYNQIYREMLEVVDGISIETIFPDILINLWACGSAFITTVATKESMCLSTILLPTKYCRTIGQTQFGTTIIQFNVEYFDDIVNNIPEDTKKIKFIADNYTEELAGYYKKYLKNSRENWFTLDPRFSTGILLNPEGIPILLYALGSLNNFETYQDNELERNTNLLKYLVVQTMPHFQTDLIFTIDEVKDLHSSLRSKIEVDDNARLITTWGDVHVDKVSENESENNSLDKAYIAIYNGS